MLKRTLVVLMLLVTLLLPNISVRSSAGFQETPKLTFDGQIAYVGEDGNVWVLRGDGSNPLQVTSDANPQRQYHSPRWSPDGARLAYCLSDQTGSGSSRLFVTWTGEWLPVAVSQDIYCKDSPEGVFDWSLDGTKIYYARNFVYNPQAGGKVWDPYYGIWEVNVISGEARELVPPPGQNPLVYPDISPDGRWIRFYELIYQEGLGVLRTWSNESSSLGNWLSLGSSIFPGLSSWSPDGTQIVFDQVTYAGFPGAGLFVAAPDGSNIKKLYSNVQVAAVQPLWSPDGQNIAFQLMPISREVKSNQLALIDPAGKKASAFYHSENSVAPVVWAPSGKQILFGDGKEGQVNLMLYDLASDTQQQVVTASNWSADWGPIPSGPPPAASLPPDALLDFPNSDELLVYISPDYSAVITNTQTSQEVALTRPMSVAGFTPSPSRHNLVYGTRWMTLDFREGGKLSVHTTSLPGQPAEGKLSWSPDETRLVFQAQDGSVWAVDQGGKSLQIPQATTLPSWSYDGKWLSYCTGEGDTPHTLWVVGPVSAPKQVAEQVVGLCQQLWSSGQDLLAFTTESGEGGTQDAYLYDPASDKTTPLIQSTAVDSWSPDGKYLALRRPDARGFVVFAVEPKSGKQLFVGRFDDRNLGLVGWLATDAGYFFGPYRISEDLANANKVSDILFDATQDGKTLLVGIGPSNLVTLACLQAETGQQSKLLTFDLSLVPVDQKPGVTGQLSPDGTWVLAHGYNASGPVTSLYRCDGASQVSLPAGNLPGKDAFSQDGRWYAYSQLNSDGKGEIVLQDLAGKEVKNIPAMSNSAAYWIRPLNSQVSKTFLVSGRVTGADGSPLSDVSVLADGEPAANTAEDGTYVISGLSQGRHTLVLQKEGYLFSPAEGKVNLPPDATGINFSGSLPSTGTPPPPPTSIAPPVAALQATPTSIIPIPAGVTEFLAGVPPYAIFACAGLLILIILVALVVLVLRWRKKGRVVEKPAAPMPMEEVHLTTQVAPVQKGEPVTSQAAENTPQPTLVAEEDDHPTQPVPVTREKLPPTQPAEMTTEGPSPTQTLPVQAQETIQEPSPQETADMPAAESSLPPQEDVHALLQQGIAQVKGTELSQGMEKLRRVVQIDPDNANAWLWLGWAAAQQKDLRSAERCFRRAQKLGHPKAEDGLKWLSRKQK